MKNNIMVSFIAGALLFGSAGVFAGQYIATENPFPIKLNGQDINIEGYNIDGSTYFKLRDIADVVGGFDVEFSNNTILLQKPSDIEIYCNILNSISEISQSSYEIYNNALGDYVSYRNGTLVGMIDSYLEISNEHYAELKGRILTQKGLVATITDTIDCTELNLLLNDTEELIDYYIDNSSLQEFDALWERNNEDEDAIPFNKFYAIKQRAENLLNSAK
ncbi:MAG: hypothetical protein ACI4DP_04305 [Candidatus Ornithomonoglobus sp.]